MTTTRARLRGGIDLGGTKIQAVVVDGRNQVRGKARVPTPRGGPAAVAAAMAETLRTALESAGASRGQLVAAGVERRAPSTWPPARSRTRATSQAGRAPSRSATRCRRTSPCRCGSAMTSTSRRRPVPARRRQGLPVGARRLLGHGRRRRPGAERPALVGPRCLGRDRPRRGADGRPAVPVWSARLHRGVRRPRGVEAGLARGRQGYEDGAVRDHGARAARIVSRAACGRRRSRRRPPRDELIDEAMAALAAGVASANNLLDIDAIVLGGGLGTRFGQPFADRLARKIAGFRSPTDVPRRCWLPRWVTWAARSAPRSARKPAGRRDQTATAPSAGLRLVPRLWMGSSAIGGVEDEALQRLR